MVMVMVMAAVRGVAVISSKLFNCMFCGSICGVGSGSGVNSCCGGSSLAHHFHHYHHHHYNHHHQNQLHHHLHNTAYT